MSEMATLIPPGGLPPPTAGKKTFGVEAIAMTKRFGEFVALDQVSLKVRTGTFHALLGENGAGKSTLVKCIMGYYQADGGELIVDERQEIIGNPRAAHALGLGMVYQHFTSVPAMTVAENFVLARDHVPAVVDWTRERKALEEFLVAHAVSRAAERQGVGDLRRRAAEMRDPQAAIPAAPFSHP